MGMFGRKKLPDGAKTVFYDGDLPGFTVNAGCQLLVTDEVLRITRINPDIEVHLDKKRVNAIEYFLSEQEYMKKYKGNVGMPLKKGDIPKYYYVIHYNATDGMAKHIDVWCTPIEAVKMRKEMEKLKACIQPSSYEI